MHSLNTIFQKKKFAMWCQVSSINIISGYLLKIFGSELSLQACFQCRADITRLLPLWIRCFQVGSVLFKGHLHHISSPQGSRLKDHPITGGQKIVKVRGWMTTVKQCFPSSTEHCDAAWSWEMGLNPSLAVELLTGNRCWERKRLNFL